MSRPRTKAYIAWMNMKQRCLNPKSTYFSDYGGRGIQVCERWIDFKNFFSDMGDPQCGQTLDRKNNDGNYEPSNCRWTTRKNQAQNRRSTRRLEFLGKSLPLIEWSRITGLDWRTISYRLGRGWTVEDALTRPKISLGEAGKLGAVGKWRP